MGRPLPRLLSLLLVLLLLPAAAGQRVGEDVDDRGDVTSRPGVEADEPTVDLVAFTADLEGDALVLRNEVAGALPLSGEPNATRLYTFLFAVDIQGSRDQPLVQSADAVVVCTFHHGASDLSCYQSQGDRTILGVGAEDRNVTVRLAVAPGESVEPVVGGGAVTLKDEPSDTILAQDWTPTTVGGQDAPDQEEPEGGDGERAWTRRPATGLAVAAALLGLSLLAWRRLRKRA